MYCLVSVQCEVHSQKALSWYFIVNQVIQCFEILIDDKYSKDNVFRLSAHYFRRCSQHFDPRLLMLDSFEPPRKIFDPQRYSLSRRKEKLLLTWLQNLAANFHF